MQDGVQAAERKADKNVLHAQLIQEWFQNYVCVLYRVTLMALADHHYVRRKVMIVPPGL